MRHLILNLEAPLMAFGGETIDNHGVTRWFPAASMLSGLLANALGWRRIERRRHQALQDRLVFAARIDREPAGGIRLRDFQTAQLAKNDEGWTTRGKPEGRGGGPATYDAPHLRYRDYLADMRVTVALRLHPEGEAPTLDDLTQALQHPARPLFIGRKPCLPSVEICAGYSNGATPLAALLTTPLDDREAAPQSVKLLWPEVEVSADEVPAGVRLDRPYVLTDQRNWLSGLHGGGREVCEGTVSRGLLPDPIAAAEVEGEEG